SIVVLGQQLTGASGSVGGARPCQGRGRGFESRLALLKMKADLQNADLLFSIYRKGKGMQYEKRGNEKNTSDAGGSRLCGCCDRLRQTGERTGRDSGHAGIRIRGWFSHA